MCGRLDVKGEEVNEAVQIDLGIPFDAATNRDLKPTQTVSVATTIDGQLRQQDTRWGIKPSWATSHLINAKYETVTDKQTFTKAFAFNRCLVPCTGFYEWMKTSKGKVKVWFHHREGGALYMGAFWYPGERPELVTLTRDALVEHMHIHHRFPVFIDPVHASTWLNAHPKDAQAMCLDWCSKQIDIQPTE